jgi:hypothetical protein
VTPFSLTNGPYGLLKNAYEHQTKEYFMKKRQFLVLGLLALFLVLITGLTGCDSDPGYKEYVTFYNQSRYTIQVDVTTGNWNPSSFSLRAGASKKVGSNTSTSIYFNWRIADTGWTGNGVRSDGNYPTFTFYNR